MYTEQLLKNPDHFSSVLKEQVRFLAVGEDLRVVCIQKQQYLKEMATIHTGFFFLSTVQIHQLI